MKEKIKMIKVKESVHKRLIEKGKKKETFSDIIGRHLK